MNEGKPRRPGVIGRARRWAVLAALALAALGFSAPTANAGDVLIYGPSLLGAPNNEATLATAAGHTVTVADPVTWSAMTTAQFASFDAIVFGDPSCRTSEQPTMAAAEANKATWSAAVRGNMVVIGTDPVFHQFQGQANRLTTNAINFAASGGRTGVYANLSCYHFSSPPNTLVSFLSGIGEFRVQGQFSPPLNGCPQDVEIVLPGHPVVSGIAEAGLENWGCSIHEAFNKFPASLSTIVRDAPTDLPYIIAGKSPRAGPGPPFKLVLDPKEEANEVGTQHCVTATVTDEAGEPVPGITVVFDVEGASELDQNPPDEDGTATTNDQGQATFCYTGPDFPGKDVIKAFADTNKDGQQDPPPPLGNEPFDVADKLWVLPAPTPGCEVTISNGGWIIAQNGDRASLGGHARVSGVPATVKGNQEYQDHGPAQELNYHSNNVLTAVCSSDRTEATLFAEGTVDGMGSFMARITLKDDGEPGSGATDTYDILIDNGYDSGEDRPLQGGNIQIQVHED